MLVSDEYKFIYIKSRKTASTSLEKYFKPYCKNGIIQEKKAHLEAGEIREMIGQEKWESYVKICAIRNPWDKMVSFYFWKRRLRWWNKFIDRIMPSWSNYSIAHDLTFKEFIRQNPQPHLDDLIILLDGKWPQDYLFIRYENLHEDLEKVCETIGIPFEPGRLKKLKAGFRPNKHYQQFYDEETKELVRATYAEDIKQIGYEF